MPSESEAFKECERQIQATMMRVEKMRFEAMKRGYFLKLSPLAYLEQSAALFKQPDSPRDPDSMPRLKFSEAIKLANIEKI